jgi:TPP-dependent pyruvate/acetoin dehydrogenase alpha subunit
MSRSFNLENYKILGNDLRLKGLSEHELGILEAEMINFEDRIVGLWENAKIPYPVHFSGGNEKQLIEIFKDINREDYKISTHRGHYHYLLSGGSPRNLYNMILRGDSMHLFDKQINFMTSSIVAGMPSIAAGIAKAIKEKNKGNFVWCFVGDGAEDEGHFYEAVRYVEGHNLPCKFIIEDNNLSVETPKSERYGTTQMNWPPCVYRYGYVRKYPHVGTGKIVDFSKAGKSDGEVGGTLV